MDGSTNEQCRKKGTKSQLGGTTQTRPRGAAVPARTGPCRHCMCALQHCTVSSFVTGMPLANRRAAPPKHTYHTLCCSFPPYHTLCCYSLPTHHCVHSASCRRHSRLEPTAPLHPQQLTLSSMRCRVRESTASLMSASGPNRPPPAGGLFLADRASFRALLICWLLGSMWRPADRGGGREEGGGRLLMTYSRAAQTDQAAHRVLFTHNTTHYCCCCCRSHASLEATAAAGVAWFCCYHSSQ